MVSLLKFLQFETNESVCVCVYESERVKERERGRKKRRERGRKKRRERETEKEREREKTIRKEQVTKDPLFVFGLEGKNEGIILNKRSEKMQD